MKKGKDLLTRIAALLLVCAMVLSLLPVISADAATTKKSKAYKSTKTITCYLVGRERKTITMPSDIARVSFGSQGAVKMRKASPRKVAVSGIRNGRTKFTVVTKDKRRIICNVIRTTKFNMGSSEKRVINMNIKVKSVKSSNTKLATVKLAKNKKSYTITTKKKGTLKITVKYANNKVETLSLSIAHQHKWKTVVDKKAYDESVYETQDVYETRDVYTDKPVYEEHWFNNGVDVTAGTNDFNAAHGTNYAGGDRCIIDDLNAYLAECGATSGRDYSEWIQVGTEKVKTGTKKVKVGTKKVKVGTKHHAAVTHQECTTCGARKK